MFNNISAFIYKHKKKILVSFSFALIIAFFATIFYVHSNNKTNTIEINATQQQNVEDFPQTDLSDALVLNYSLEATSGKTVKSLASTTTNGWTVQPSPAPTFVGGSTFSLVKNDAHLKANVSGTNYSFYPGSFDFGYEFGGYEIGIQNNTTTTPKLTAKYAGGNWTFSGTLAGKNGSFTTEDLMSNDDYSTGYKIYIAKLQNVITKTVKLWYAQNDSLDIGIKIEGQATTLTQDKSKKNGDKYFGAWSVDYYDIYQLANSYNSTNYQHNKSGVTINNNYPTTDTGTLKIDQKSNGIYLELAYSRYIAPEQSYNGHPYYYITSIKGYIADNVLMGANYNKGLVYAKWSNKYTLTIDNQSANQVGKTNSANVSLSGAYYYNGTSKSGGNTVSFSIQDRTDCLYPIQKDTFSYGSTTYGYAFMTSSDFDNSAYSVARMVSGNTYYYVYNYGYKLSGWKIYFVYNSVNYSLTRENNKWRFKSGTISTITLANLTDFNMAKLSLVAENVDSYIQSNIQVGNIIMKPVWAAASVQVKYTDTFKYTATFGSALNANTNSFPTEIGKSFAYYTTKESNQYSALANADGKNIILVGNANLSTKYKFNYVNLSTEQFTFSKADSVYTLEVEPNFLDNIYKVKLDDPNGHNATNLINTDYAAATASYSLDTYKWHTLATEIGYSDFNNSGLIESYISNKFINALSVYKNSIKNYTSTCVLKNLLRKVFNNATDGLYIYLANNQQTGVLPVFNDSYEDLIFWYGDAINDALSENNGFVYRYKTNAFNANEIEHVNSKHTNYKKEYLEHNDRIWTFEDAYNSSNDSRTLHAYYYRKYYNINVQTLLQGQDARVGVVQLKITDNKLGTDSYYVIVYNNNSNVYYMINQPSVDYRNIRNNANFGEFAPIRIYANSDLKITAYDQNSLYGLKWFNYSENDCMIGYRSTGIAVSSELANAQTSSVNISAAEIASKWLNTGDYIFVAANFGVINYSITFELPEINSGDLDKYYNGLVEKNKTTHVVDNLNVLGGDKVYSIVYNAKVGFEFEEFDTIQYTPDELTKTSLANSSVLTNQTFILTFNNTWLKTNYYLGYLNSFPTAENQNLGKILVNTKEIEFDYTIKLYDSTNATPYFGEIEVGKASLNFKENGILTANGVLPAIQLEQVNGAYFVKYQNNNYALLNSRLHFPGNASTTNGNNYTTYPFLLTTNPTTNYAINTPLLSKMLNRGNGTIVPSDERVLYIRFDVRELFELTVKVVKDANDTNTTERSITVSNELNGRVLDGNNDIVATVHANELADENIYKTVKGYSYNKKSNIITSVFDANRYSGVEYYLDVIDTGSKLSSNVFTTDGNNVLFVKFVPKALDAVITYSIDSSVPETLINPSQYVDFVTASSIEAKSYYINDKINISINLLNEDYNLSVVINQATVNLDHNENDGNPTYTSSYTVSDKDFNFNNIDITVKLTKKLNSGVRFEYILFDPAQREDYDNMGFGSYKVLVNDEEQTLTDSRIVNIVVGKSLKVDISGLKSGYSFYGWKKAGTSEIYQEIVGDILTITESFEPNPTHGDDYYIFIKKDEVVAVMPTNENVTIYASNVSSYVDETTGITKLDNLYVGKTIQFSNAQVDDEELAYYYYKIGANTIPLIDQNNNAVSSLVLTSEILDQIGKTSGVWQIEFGFATVKKYKLDYTLLNEENLSATDGFSVLYKNLGERKITLEGEIYYDDSEETNEYLQLESGHYILSNKLLVYEIVGNSEQSLAEDLSSDIKLIVNSLVAGKYDITLSGSLYNTNLDAVDLNFALTKDESITISITPKTFAVNVNETVYKNLADLQNETPNEEANINEINISNTSFNATAQLKIDRKILKTNETEHRELKTIVITDKDGNETKVEISEIAGSVQVSGFTFVLTESQVVVTYLVDDDITIQLDYITYKLLHGID